jgi:hypothetical protein
VRTGKGEPTELQRGLKSKDAPRYVPIRDFLRYYRPSAVRVGCVMEDGEACLKDSLARAVKALGKAGQSSRVVRGEEEAFRRAQGMRGLEEILAEVRAETVRAEVVFVQAEERSLSVSRLQDEVEGRPRLAVAERHATR